IDRAEVRQRALAALEALGPASRVPPERRALITDYLLGALPQAVADEVREHLGQSASERAWARAVRGELQSLAEHPLPDLPADSGSRADSEEAAPAPVDATPGAAGRDPERPASSRRGGAFVLAGSAAVVLAVVLILLLTSESTKRPAPRP